MAENKIQNYRGTVGLRAQTATSWDTTIVPCTPFTAFLSILRGLVKVRGLETQFRVKKLKFSGVLRPYPYNAATNPTPAPLIVKMLWMTRKSNPMEIYTNVSDLLQYGTTSEGPGTALQNLHRPINLDEWTVHHTAYLQGRICCVCWYR